MVELDRLSNPGLYTSFLLPSIGRGEEGCMGEEEGRAYSYMDTHATYTV